jgi:UDP:flavonoid glycosyltransferase YjiC (YdhE family)
MVIGHFFVFPLRVAAEKAHKPMATVNVVHNCIPSDYTCPPGLPDLGKWFYPWGWKLVKMMINRIFLPRVNALRSREGLRPDTDVMSQTWAAERLNLLAVSPSICNRPKDWDVRHHVCGFINPPQAELKQAWPNGLDGFLSAGSPPVYFTFGSMMLSDLTEIRKVLDIWQKAVEQLGCRAIMQIPWDDVTAFKTDPNIFILNRSPYAEVFPLCAVIVHHGGAGTTQSSLLAGRPSVVVAHMADQTFWGSELKRLGVAGNTLHRKTLTPSKLANTISHVLNNPTMDQNAESLGKQMAKENGTANAVQSVNQIFCH